MRLRFLFFRDGTCYVRGEVLDIDGNKERINNGAGGGKLAIINDIL